LSDEGVVYAAIAAFGTLATAIIMFVTYLKQNNLFNLQMRHYEGGQLERLRKHFREIAGKLQGIVKCNDSTINQSGREIYNDWECLKMYYSAPEITNDLKFHDALIHIQKDIPDFTQKVDEFANRVNQLNISVDRLRQSKIDRVKKKLSLNWFKLEETSDGRPYIMDVIEKYWFLDMLTVFFKEKTPINEIRDNLKPLKDTPTTKGKHNITHDNEFIFFSSNRMCGYTHPANEDKFLTDVMELVTEQSTWLEIYAIITERKDIAEELKSFNGLIQPVIQTIYHNKYSQTFDCCVGW
jgi:hypothetical protein